MSVSPGGARSDAGHTREQILDAADQFLIEHPFRDLTVSEIMERTSVSRPAFYQYFHDRYDIAGALVNRLTDVTMRSGRAWIDADGGREGCAAALVEYAGLVAPHGYLLKAICDAQCADERIEALWRGGFIKAYIERIAHMIQLEQTRGRVPADLDAELTAKALVFVVERLAIDCFPEPDPDPETIDRVGKTWAAIWCSTLYPGRAG